MTPYQEQKLHDRYGGGLSLEERLKAEAKHALQLGYSGHDQTGPFIEAGHEVELMEFSRRLTA